MKLSQFFTALIPISLLSQGSMYLTSYRKGECVNAYRGFGKWCGFELLTITTITILVGLISLYILVKYWCLKKEN